MREKCSEYREMLSEAALMLRQVAEPQGNTKATIALVARKFGWKPSRAKSIWYQEARRIDGHEILALQAEYSRLCVTTKNFMAALESANPHCSRQELVADLRRIAAISCMDRA